MLRVAVSYRDGRNYQSGRGAIVRKVQDTRQVSSEDIDNSRYPHLKDIEIPKVQVKAVSVLIGKEVDYAPGVRSPKA